MGWVVPVFAHVPLIHGQDGAKLSKRHGALGVEAYRDQGFLPEGLANYLLRLGWAHGDEEIIPYERAKQLFDLKGINKAPARLDIDKLGHVNAQYIAALSDNAFVEWATPFLLASGITLDTDNAARLLRSAPFLKPRCATLADSVAASEYLFLQRPLEITGKTAKPLEKDGAKALLGELAAALDDKSHWASAAALDETLQGFIAERNIGFGVIGPPARAALTGGRPSPGLGEVLYGLGRDESRARLADQAA
jgi:glutamyl-tRNA synthetase